MFNRCSEISYRVSSAPKLHREFRKALKKLPKTYSAETKQQFYKLIDDFGTHYITKVNHNNNSAPETQQNCVSHF